MRTSIIIAAHNEGEALGRTIEACIANTAGLDIEIVVADDASTDGSVEQVQRRFPVVQVDRHEERLGVSPARMLGAVKARGEVFLFLDGHTNPEPGAIGRLIAGVEETHGEAIVTPQITGLDLANWKNDPNQRGFGYGVDLSTLECRWLQLKELRQVRVGRREYYESPSLIGCALAIGRKLYDQLWGWDRHMLCWGVEDQDLALKCWHMGFRVLHDPAAVIGHRFRSHFDNFDVPMQHVLVNKFRLARKNFTDSTWANWLERQRELHSGPLDGHPEGLWALAWNTFERGSESVEQERSYLMARRKHDEFWYAERFGLTWPRLELGGGVVALAKSATGSPSPSRQPSPSPPPGGCALQIAGPADVPGLSKYTYQITLPAGQTVTNIQWTVDKPTATFTGATNQLKTDISFTNTAADWITLRANFVLNGQPACAEKHIALVRVQLGPAAFTRPGTVSGTAGGSNAFLVNPPAAPAVATWITTHTPGSACGAFTYNGTIQAAEPRVLIDSHGGGGGSAVNVATLVTLTSPAQNPNAHHQIQIGFIQHGSDSGSTNYATNPPGGKRTVTVPTTDTVDWLTRPCNPGATDVWPWYDQSSMATGTGSGSFSTTLTLDDSPSMSFPAQFNPNAAADPNAATAITTGAESLAFTIRIAARTTDADMGADTFYFDQGHSTWAANFVWPVIPGVSIVTTGGNWTPPASASAASVNVVPTVTCHNNPFLRFMP